MRLNKLRVLDDDELTLIHRESLKILEKIGIRVESEDSREIFNTLGAAVDSKKQIIRLPSELIENALKTCPSRFSIYGPSGETEVKIGKSASIFATQGSPSKIYDKSAQKKLRNATLEDFKNYLRVAEQTENISCVQLDVWPTDVRYEEVHKFTIPEWAEISSKPLGMGCRGQKASKETVELITNIAGGQQELRDRPRLMVFFNTMSPLILPENLLEGLMVMASMNQPVIVAPAATAGMTAPITLTGLLAQVNAEILASIVLIQAINPGCPVLYGSVNSPMDPFSLNVSWGSVETGLITTASAQLADFYKIPSRAPGAITSSNIPYDIQSGFERMMNLMMAAYSGINYITCAGTYANGEASSLELLELDDELIGTVLRGMKGIEVDEQKIPLKVIRSILSGEQPNYLKMRHTLKNTRKELFIPKLSERRRYNQWLDEGANSMFDNAHNKVEKVRKSKHN